MRNLATEERKTHVAHRAQEDKRENRRQKQTLRRLGHLAISSADFLEDPEEWEE